MRSATTSLRGSGDTFLSAEAADYAELRADEVQREGGLQKDRLFTNMLSSMPLCFSVFGHLRAHTRLASRLLSSLLDVELAELVSISIGRRTIAGIECEWSPERRDHLDDGSAFDAAVAGLTLGGRSLLVAVETKYVDSFSCDPENAEKDAKYRGFCERFGMADSAFDHLRGPSTRQLLRNVLLAESVRRGGRSGPARFDDAVTVVLARDVDNAARRAVATVAEHCGALQTSVRFVGHSEFATAAAALPELADWTAGFRRRYLPTADEVTA